MPYIKKEQRQKITGYTETILDISQIDSAGDMNYAFSMIIKKYMKKKGERYQHYNDCIGALEGAKLELYRRLVAEYEEKAVDNNGDIY